MKKVLFLLLLTLPFLGFRAPQSQNYKEGEFLKYRVHYGLLNAGFATLTVNSTTYDGREHYHVIGEGSSSGAVRAFYKVDDYYESYIDVATNRPSRFLRNIREGGYTRHQLLTFDYNTKMGKVDDKKKNKISYRMIENDVQDLLSAFYFFRNVDTDGLKTGEFIGVDIFLADETYKFKLKILGRETKRTKFGKIKTIKVRPYVQSGRIFKASESVTMWITDDKNHIPVQIKADLMVGSLKADLDEYRDVKYPMNFKN